MELAAQRINSFIFRRGKDEKVRAFCRFVSLEDGEGTLEVFEERKWPSILSSESFINWIKERFYSGKLYDEGSQYKEWAPGVGVKQKGGM